jgi:hypothetical protein
MTFDITVNTYICMCGNFVLCTHAMSIGYDRYARPLDQTSSVRQICSG